MRAPVRLVLVAAPLWIGAALPALAASPDPGFEVQTVAPGVYAAARREPPGFWFDCNSVFVVNDRDVVVVDTNVSPESARATLAALRKITDKPVSHVVSTHWHDDHIAGNQVYRDAFPGVRFVGHVRTRGELERGETLEQARKSVELSEFREAIAGDSQLRQLGFDNHVADPGGGVAYREAKEKQ